MKVKEALYDLIKSLSKSEKRYFKLYASRHTIGDSNNYVLLFDYLDHLTHYDENKLRLHFYGEAFLNKFSITKKRLYNHVLDALNAYHSTKSVEAKMYNMLSSVDVLHEKSLYEQSRRVLDSVVKLAKKTEAREVLLICARKERRYLETTGYLSMNLEKLNEKKNDQQAHLGYISELNDLWTLKSQIFHRLRTKGVARSEEDLALYNEIYADLLEMRFKHPSNYKNYLLAHSCSAYHFAVGNKVASLEQINRAIYFLKCLEGKDIEVNRLISLLTNAVYLSDELGEYENSIEILSELKQFIENIQLTKDLEVKLFSSVASLELGLHLRKGNIDAASDLIQHITLKIDKYSNKLLPERKAYLHFKIAVTHVAKGDFQEALKYVNEIINDAQMDKTEDIYGVTQILDLLIHIELQNDELVAYSLKSVQRFFKTRNRYYGFEKVMLKYLGKITRTSDHFDRIELWGELYVKLQEVTDDGFQNVTLEYFDFSAWAISKSTEKPFNRVIEEKYKSNAKA